MSSVTIQSKIEPVERDEAPTKLVDRVFRLRELGIIAILALLVLVTAAIQPRFVDVENIKFTLMNSTIYAFLALGETVVIISRNVDLSVGSVLGFSAYVSANLFSQVHGIPVVAVFAVGLAIGIGFGMINGAIVAALRVPSLVVTLATLYVIQGLDITIVGGGEVVPDSLPHSFLVVGSASVVGIPYVTIAVAVVIAAGAYYLRTFRSGRELYAIGSNPDAARLAGIPTGKRIFMAFVISGGIAGLAGVIWAAHFGTVTSTAGTTYELLAIAGAVVGGVAIFGGSGSAIGAAFGALLLGTINQALYVLGVSSLWDGAIAGLLLVIAIALDRGISVRLNAALRKRNVQRGA